MMATLTALPPSVLSIIFEHLFLQPNHEILGLSREPDHDYSRGPPSDWIADSRQAGLVYNEESARPVPTNSRALRTCKIMHEEGVEIFYQTNKIRLYAEDNNDIFYWLLDIGERNRAAIRHLEIGWAYGVSIDSGGRNIHGILQSITDMTDSCSSSILKQRAQLVALVQRLETKTCRLIIRTLNFVASSQSLHTLAVYLPGVDGGDIWDLPNDNLYFEKETFSNSTTNVHACIPEALAKMKGVRRLEIGYTKDIELAEEIARRAGARELVIRACAEGQTLNLHPDEKEVWKSRGWSLNGPLATKVLGESQDTASRHTDRQSVDPKKEDILEGEEDLERGRKGKRAKTIAKDTPQLQSGYSEGGRLRASMIMDSSHAE